MILQKRDASTPHASNNSWKCIDRSEKRFPRLWNIIVVVMVPLLLLMCWAMFCGHFLVVLESGEELKANNAALAENMKYISNLAMIRDSVKNAYDGCFANFVEQFPSIEALNGTELLVFMEDCTSADVSESNDLVEKMQESSYQDTALNALSLNWNKFSKVHGPSDMNDGSWQKYFFYEEWINSFKLLTAGYAAEGINEDEAFMLAIDEASGSSRSEVNTAGGALFWFTIMTTIGYGNTAPVTTGGRAMVYTLGFVSILAFTTCIGTSGHISLAIMDDLFKRLELHRLVEGWISVIFWLSALWLWILANAAMYYIRIGESEGTSFVDSFWWAYISMTTIGLGDVHISHSRFDYIDAVYSPFCLLIGFVFFANFLLKLSQKIKSMTEKAGITDDESLGFLLRLRREASTPKSIDVEDSIGTNASDLETAKTNDIVDDRGTQNEICIQEIALDSTHPISSRGICDETGRKYLNGNPDPSMKVPVTSLAVRSTIWNR